MVGEYAYGTRGLVHEWGRETGTRDEGLGKELRTIE